MTLPNRIFISYAHIDNEVLGSGQQGWITSFHKALEIRLSQLMGRRPDIWRDQKLKGNDLFGDEIVDQFPEVAILISILSPRYLTSEWCPRELDTFCRVAEQSLGLRVGNKSRVFKVIKTAIPIDKHPNSVRDLLGYEFYREDPHSGRARELSQMGPPELERLYWAKLDDLAYDIAQLMETMPAEQVKPVPKATPVTAAAATPEGKTENAHLNGNEKVIYLANTSYDLREERDAIRRDLQQYGHEVIPAAPTPLFIDDLTQAVNEELSRADLSVHLVGRGYGIVPEGSTFSVVALEAELASKRDRADGFEWLIWMPPEMDVEDDRQLAFYEFLYTDKNIQEGADILETPLEDLKAVIHEKLKPKAKEPEPRDDEQDLTRIYIMCESRDLEDVEPLEDYLYDQGYEVIMPIFEGDESQIREDHQENLRTCAAVIIYFGHANELWLRAKLRELQKIAGYGRTNPLKVKAIYAGGPSDRKKDRLRSREALVLKGQDGFTPSLLSDFITRLNQG